MNDPIALAEDLVRRALRAGADEAEAYFVENKTTRIELREQRVETLTTAGSRGIGLRALVGGATSYLYTPDLTRRRLAALARQAVSLAREAAPDPDRRLPELDVLAGAEDLMIFDSELASVEPEQKIELLKSVERASREADSRVQSTEIARYGDSIGTVALANSRGLAASFRRSSASAVLVVIARQGEDALRGSGYSASRGFKELSPERIGKQAAERATRPLGGRPGPTRRATVVMEPEVAAEFLAQLANALSGEAVMKGRSMFVGRLGERIGSNVVTLIDQGNLIGGLGSAPFDGEGVATSRTLLVEEGVLRGFLHNTYTARRTGASSTGNSVRAGYQGGPGLGPTNFSLQAQASTKEELIGSVEQGLQVMTTRNVGGINPVSGDYSVGASGVWLENGQDAGPAAGVTIAANMFDMLSGLAAVGDDFRWSLNGCAIGTASIRVDGMTIAGE